MLVICTLFGMLGGLFGALMFRKTPAARDSSTNSAERLLGGVHRSARAAKVDSSTTGRQRLRVPPSRSVRRRSRFARDPSRDSADRPAGRPHMPPPGCASSVRFRRDTRYASARILLRCAILCRLQQLQQELHGIHELLTTCGQIAATAVESGRSETTRNPAAPAPERPLDRRQRRSCESPGFARTAARLRQDHREPRPRLPIH